MELVFASVITSDCDCGIFPTQITNSSVLCPPLCSDQVLYNARISVPVGTDKEVLAALLSSWADRGTPITVASHELIPSCTCSAVMRTNIPSQDNPTQTSEGSQAVILYGLITMFAISVIVLCVFLFMVLVNTVNRTSHSQDQTQQR